MFGCMHGQPYTPYKNSWVNVPNIGTLAIGYIPDTTVVDRCVCSFALFCLLRFFYSII